jgi:outer membrane protein assembly factor BamB
LDGAHAKAWSLDLPQVSRSGITIDGTTAYVGTNDGTVTAVDAQTGEVRWTADVGGRIETPVAAGAGVVIASVTGTDVNAPARLVAVHDTDGSPGWTYTPDRPFALGGSVTLVDDTAYVVFPNNQLNAVAADSGRLRWSARMTNPSIFPVSATADAVYVADAFGEVYRFDPSTGDRVWTFALNEPILRAGPLLIGAHVVLVTLRGDVVALDAATGDLVFRGAASDHPLRDAGANGDALVIVGTRSDTGLIGLTSDPAGSLVRERSPTIVDPSRFALGFVAVVPMLVVLLFAGRAWWNRLGPIELGAPEDAWEADADDGGNG